jgi:hypothetical protein
MAIEVYGLMAKTVLAVSWENPVFEKNNNKKKRIMEKEFLKYEF